MPVPSCLHSSIKRLPSSARNLLVVPDLLWFDLFSACLCNSLKPGFPFSEQNADLFGKSIISPVFSCSTSEQELNWAQSINKFTTFPSAHPYSPSSNAFFWVWVVGRWGIAGSGNASSDGSESPGIPVSLWGWISSQQLLGRKVKKIKCNKPEGVLLPSSGFHGALSILWRLIWDGYILTPSGKRVSGYTLPNGMHHLHFL